MQPENEAKQLADRLYGYADAVAAIAFVNLLAFSVAVADQEVRCSLVHLRAFVVICGVVLHTGYLLAIFAFRRGESRSRR